MTDLADILARQRAAFLRYAVPDLGQRGADLEALRRAIVSRPAQIEAAIDADFGHRSRHETALMEILPTLQGIANPRPAPDCCHFAEWCRSDGKTIQVR